MDTELSILQAISDQTLSPEQGQAKLQALTERKNEAVEIGELIHDYERVLVRWSFVGDSAAHDLIYKLEDHLGIYEDVYEQIVEIIEPHVRREGVNPDGFLPASVVGSVGVLLEKAVSERAQALHQRAETPTKKHDHQ